jgi:hypothetical protein
MNMVVSSTRDRTQVDPQLLGLYSRRYGESDQAFKERGVSLRFYAVVGSWRTDFESCIAYLCTEVYAQSVNVDINCMSRR